MKPDLVSAKMRREIIDAPAWWIPGGHLQTLWGKLFRRQPPAPTALERLETADGDFLELHRLPAPAGVGARGDSAAGTGAATGGRFVADATNCGLIAWFCRYLQP